MPHSKGHSFGETKKSNGKTTEITKSQENHSLNHLYVHTLISTVAMINVHFSMSAVVFEMKAIGNTFSPPNVPWNDAVLHFLVPSHRFRCGVRVHVLSRIRCTTAKHTQTHTHTYLRTLTSQLFFGLIEIPAVS